MEPAENDKRWHTCGYVRLSCEDGDGRESNSVTGQKNLIRDYISRRPELIECGMKVDDGFSGSDFERPAFREMMEEVKAGKINCIVVKDLSRFGRNYLDAGEYIERIFPFLGVRFIAVNDNYDSLNDRGEMESFLIPFKNLINEAYCRDISVKIKSQLAVKRKRGDFVGAFAVYGYKKDSDNKNRLVRDDFAAGVVRDIFRLKLEGVSAGDIADRLNEEGVLSPMAYKKAEGLRYATPFSPDGEGLWTASAVLRILKNPVYTGVLAQGKTTAVSFRVKRRVEKPGAEWDVAKNAHEAVISGEDFAVVQKLLARDTRTSPGGKKTELFSGMVFCGECGGPMVRKTVPAKNRKYVYYVCGTHKNEKTCFSHSMPAGALEDIVLFSLQGQIRMQGFRDKGSPAGLAVEAARRKNGENRLKAHLERRQAEAEKCRLVLDSLSGNLAKGVIDRAEYEELKKGYRIKLLAAEHKISEIREKMCRAAKEDKGVIRRWEQFEKYGNVTKLDRAMTAFMIDGIFIRRNKRVEIVYNWRQEGGIYDVFI